MPKTDQERREFLSTIGLNPDAPALETPSVPSPTNAAVASVRLAPEGVDPHTMPVTDIEFDPALLDGFPSLEGQGLRDAADYVFKFYKSPGRNKERNKPLWSEVGKFIARTKEARRPVTGYVKEVVKASKEERDLAKVLAKTGMTTADLIALIQKSDSHNG